MGYKNDDSCLLKVDDDEPIFVLRAQDKTAPATIRYWEGRQYNLSPTRTGEVHKLIALIEEWQAAHPERVKMPD